MTSTRFTEHIATVLAFAGIALGGTHASAQDIKAFVHTLQGWEHNIQNFDAAQGGIFEARFDNELLGDPSRSGESEHIKMLLMLS